MNSYFVGFIKRYRIIVINLIFEIFRVRASFLHSILKPFLRQRCLTFILNSTLPRFLSSKTEKRQTSINWRCRRQTMRSCTRTSTRTRSSTIDTSPWHRTWLKKFLKIIWWVWKKYIHFFNMNRWILAISLKREWFKDYSRTRVDDLFLMLLLNEFGKVFWCCVSISWSSPNLKFLSLNVPYFFVLLTIKKSRFIQPFLNIRQKNQWY